MISLVSKFNAVNSNKPVSALLKERELLIKTIYEVTYDLCVSRSLCSLCPDNIGCKKLERVGGHDICVQRIVNNL